MPDGLTIKLYIVNEGTGDIRLIPYSKWTKLHKRDPDVVFPEYKGKRIKYAEVFIETKTKKFITIEYGLFKFDGDGRIDWQELTRQMQVGFQALLERYKKGSEGQPVPQNKERLHPEFRWEPLPETVDKIARLLAKQNVHS